MRILLASLLLVSCQTKQADKAIYQPEVLVVPAGVPIKTLDGIYTPAYNETFFSKKTVERLETIISNL
jgi:hypothetical protein